MPVVTRASVFGTMPNLISSLLIVIEGLDILLISNAFAITHKAKHKK